MEPAPMPVATFLFWVDRHPQAYFLPVAGLIALALGLALRALWRDDPAEPKRADWGWSWLILIILAAGRWPTLLLPRELGSDESQMLAGAHALTYDPVFWRSVCGGTAGPLDFFALWPAGWLCGWEGYLPARLTALALIALSLILAHQVMASLLGRASARLAGLAGLCLEAMTNGFDFLHYSTELVPITLIAGTCYAAVRRWSGPGSPWWSALGGLLLGAVLMSKLQAAPLAAVMGLSWLGAEFRHQGPEALRHRVYLMAGAILPTALFVNQVLLAGEWESFNQAYVLFNLVYTAGGSTDFWATQAIMWMMALGADTLLPFWLPGCAVWIVIMVCLRPAVDRVTRWLLVGTTMGVGISVASILLPHRPFLHYWQLLVVPFGFYLGILMKCLLAAPTPCRRQFGRWVITACALMLVGLMLVHRARKPTHFVGNLAEFQKYPRGDLAERVARYARPGDAIAIWGFANDVYVETSLRQATRDSHSLSMIDPGPLRDYFRWRFLTDVKNAKPAIFLDAVGSGNLVFPDWHLSHDHNYPELGTLIRADYVLVAQNAGGRIYLRRDLGPR